MWMIDPAVLCRKHLLGEHVEHHMFVGAMQKGIAVEGYLANNLLEVAKLQERHDALAAEMEKRGYHHKSPLAAGKVMKCYANAVRVDVEAAKADLFHRCPDCRARGH